MISGRHTAVCMWVSGGGIFHLLSLLQVWLIASRGQVPIPVSPLVHYKLKGNGDPLSTPLALKGATRDLLGGVELFG